MVTHKDTHIPPGYKKTEVGVIPEEWDCRFIADVANVKGGKRLPKGYSLQDEPTPHPYIRVSDMFPGGVKTENIKYVPLDAYPAIRNYCIFKGDIFISVAGTLGLVGKIPPELDGANLTENADRITNIRCDREYLMYWLMSDKIQQQIESIRTIGAQPKLALGRIEEFQIALPQRNSEQRAIARVLSDVDALLEALDALIEKKRALKTAAMQQLLTGKMRLPGFSGEWVTRRLGDIGMTYGGLSGKKKEDFGHGNARYIPFLNIINHTVIDIQELERVDVDPYEQQNQVDTGDILLNGSSETPEEVGMASVYLAEDDAPAYLNSFCFGYRLLSHSVADPLFLAYYLRSDEGRKLLRALAQGATRYNLSKRAFLELAFPFPEIDEQRAIAAVLSDMDAEIAALEAQREKVRQVKQGMMQVLLTGKVRLVGEAERELQNT